ncbi:MAG: hypothetical protein COA38_00090 [Fluviicola sp.]|nr:MAG: hypothetical protein COA38_00090 [Fluviicola sp.]
MSKPFSLFSNRKITDAQSVAESQAFCMKPWVHLFVSQYGSVVPCCLTPWDKEGALGDVNKQSIKEIWNGTEMRQFRKTLLKDQPDERCKSCYESERNGLKSTRKMTNALYADKLDWALDTKRNGFSEKAKPIFWDIRISNLCNFKCRICGHHSSSQWYKDAKEMGSLSHETKIQHGPKNFNELLEQLLFVFDDLEEIYFAGGEPLLMEEHWAILDLLLEHGKTDVKLRYATNFSQTVYKGRDVFQLWTRFNNVNVHASLDDTGKRGELQRSGQSWDIAVSERKRMLEVCPHVHFLVTPTINVMNIHNIGAFHKEWVLSKLISIDEFMPHTLRSPNYLSIRIFPESERETIRKVLEQHIDWVIEYVKEHPPQAPTKAELEQFDGLLDNLGMNETTGHPKIDMQLNEFRNCITYMDSKNDQHLIPEFIAFTDTLDHLRAESTRTVLPELSPLWDYTKSLDENA